MQWLKKEAQGKTTLRDINDLTELLSGAAKKIGEASDSLQKSKGIIVAKEVNKVVGCDMDKKLSDKAIPSLSDANDVLQECLIKIHDVDIEEKLEEVEKKEEPKEEEK